MNQPPPTSKKIMLFAPPTVDPKFPVEEEIAHFYALVGRVMSRWTTVEGNFFHAFLLGLGAGDRDAASALYHSINTFRTRLEMTDAAMGMRFAKDLGALKKWAALSVRGSKLSGTRNSIVHWITMYGPSEKVGRRMWLTQNSFDASVLEGHTGKPRKRLFATDLKTIDLAFCKLSNDVYAFVQSHPKR